MKHPLSCCLHAAAFILFSCLPLKFFAQSGNDWMVWVKVEPCSERMDWISVARANPSGGLNTYQLASRVIASASCTVIGCNFKDAMAVAEELRKSDQFKNYCCREYSVWENTQTRKRSVVVGKFGTAGAGWILVKANLCCEEAEELAGVPGACTIALKQKPKNNTPTKPDCWPGSYAKFNRKTKVWECFCNKGLVWNSTNTACVDPQELVRTTDCSMYAGSYAAWNAQAQRVECYCPQGKVWNSTNTACVDAASTVQCYPGSYAAWNAQTRRTECFCNTGLVWNSTKTACVDPQTLVRATDCSMYAGSYAAWNAQAQRVECYCPQGKVWNSNNTACVDANTNVQCYPGSYAAWNAQTQRTECFCNPGLVWNSTMTACVQPGSNTNTNTNTGSGTWTLVSVNAYPATAPTWQSYDPYGGNAAFRLSNGDQASFRWTPPPSQFTTSGFTLSMSVNATPGPNSRISAAISAGASGLTGSTSETSAIASPPAGPGSAQAQVTYTPGSWTSDVEVTVALMWGDVRFVYKYKKQ